MPVGTKRYCVLNKTLMVDSENKLQFKKLSKTR